MSSPDNRGTCWSIVINNPTDKDLEFNFPSGWKIEGQKEVGEQGTLHYQGCLTTPQVRFSAVKRAMPRANIQLARNKKALKAYVHKEDTRVAEVPSYSSATVFSLTDKVLAKWDDTRFVEYCEMYPKKLPKDLVIGMIDIITHELIAGGEGGGIEYVAINPMWRSAWLRFGEAMILRYKKSKQEVYDAREKDANGIESEDSEADGGQEGTEGTGPDF